MVRAVSILQRLRRHKGLQSCISARRLRQSFFLIRRRNSLRHRPLPRWEWLVFRSSQLRALSLAVSLPSCSWNGCLILGLTQAAKDRAYMASASRMFGRSPSWSDVTWSLHASTMASKPADEPKESIWIRYRPRYLWSNRFAFLLHSMSGAEEVAVMHRPGGSCRASGSDLSSGRFA